MISEIISVKGTIRFLPHIPIIAISISTIILLGFVQAYFNGYNKEVVTSIGNPARIIDDNKLILFDTSEQYYVIACEETENNSLKVYRSSYGFVDKSGVSVSYKDYWHFLNEYGNPLNDDALSDLFDVNHFVEWL